jgi:hypothetical protein
VKHLNYSITNPITTVSRDHRHCKRILKLNLDRIGIKCWPLIWYKYRCARSRGRALVSLRGPTILLVPPAAAGGVSATVVLRDVPQKQPPVVILLLSPSDVIERAINPSWAGTHLYCWVDRGISNKHLAQGCYDSSKFNQFENLRTVVNMVDKDSRVNNWATLVSIIYTDDWTEACG